MNHIERQIIVRYLRFRAGLFEEKVEEHSQHEDSRGHGAQAVAQMGVNVLNKLVEEVESQKEGKPTFAKLHFEEFEETKSKLSAKKFLDEQEAKNKKRDPLAGFGDLFERMS